MSARFVPKRSGARAAPALVAATAATAAAAPDAAATGATTGGRAAGGEIAERPIALASSAHSTRSKPWPSPGTTTWNPLGLNSRPHTRQCTGRFISSSAAHVVTGTGDAVLARRLGPVEGAVGRREDLLGAPGLREGGDSEARRHRGTVAADLRQPKAQERRLESAGELLAADQIRLGEQDGELLPAVADGEVEVADVLAEHVGEAPQHLVSGLVAVAVVDLLEVVEVGEHEGERVAEPLGAAHLDGERLGEAAAVGELGELVGDRLALDGPVEPLVLERDRGLRRQPVGELLGLVVEGAATRRIEEELPDCLVVGAEAERERPPALLGIPGAHELVPAA